MRSRNSPFRSPVRARGFHGQAGERVGVGAGGLQQLGERAVVEEAGQRLVTERQVAGEHQHRGGDVVAVPLSEPLEAGAQGAEVLGQADPGQLPAAGRWPGGQVQLVRLDVAAAKVGDARDLRGVAGQPAGELAQHALDAHHGRGPQRQPGLADVAGQGGRQRRGRRSPLRCSLGRAVGAGLAGSGVEDAEVEQGGLQSEQGRAQRLGAVAAGPVTADGGGQRLPACIDDSLGHPPGVQPGDCGHLGQRRPLQAGHDRVEAELGGGGGEALVKRTVMTGGDLTEIRPAGHQIVGAGAPPPVTISQPTTRRSFSGKAHWAASGRRAHPLAPTRVKNIRATEVTGWPANIPAACRSARSTPTRSSTPGLRGR